MGNVTSSSHPETSCPVAATYDLIVKNNTPCVIFFHWEQSKGSAVEEYFTDLLTDRKKAQSPPAPKGWLLLGGRGDPDSKQVVKRKVKGANGVEEELEERQAFVLPGEAQPLHFEAGTVHNARMLVQLDNGYGELLVPFLLASLGNKITVCPSESPCELQMITQSGEKHSISSFSKAAAPFLSALPQHHFTATPDELPISLDELSLLANASRRIYTSAEPTHPNFRLVEEVEPNTEEHQYARWALWDGGDVAVLVFRGSNFLDNSYHDVVSDVMFLRCSRFTANDPSVRVASSLKDIMEEEWYRILAAVTRLSKRTHKLLVTGHSLGGAVAHAFTLWWYWAWEHAPNSVPPVFCQVVAATFGSPMIVQLTPEGRRQEWVQRWMDSSINVARFGDVVPMCPRAAINNSLRELIFREATSANLTWYARLYAGNSLSEKIAAVVEGAQHIRKYTSLRTLLILPIGDAVVPGEFMEQLSDAGKEWEKWETSFLPQHSKDAYLERCSGEKGSQSLMWSESKWKEDW